VSAPATKEYRTGSKSSACPSTLRNVPSENPTCRLSMPKCIPTSATIRADPGSVTCKGPPSATGDQMAAVTARLPVLATLGLSSRFNGTTDYQNDIAKDPNPRRICVNIGNMRKPRYDREHDQSYRKPECPCRRRVQRHDTPPRDDQNCFIALFSSNEKLTETSIPFSAKH